VEDIVSAGAQENHARGVGKHDAVCEVGDVDDLRPAHAAIQHGVLREILRECIPATNRRRTGEQQPAFRGRIGVVGHFVGGDFLFPSGEIMRVVGGADAASRHQTDEREERAQGGVFHIR